VSAGTQVARKVANSAWSERLARFGLAAQGVLSIVIGILALRIAFGHREKANENGALKQIVSTPGGALLIWIVAIGLLAYALWRAAAAILGRPADPLVTDGTERIKAAAEAIGSGGVCAAALQIAIGGASSGGNGSNSQQAGTVLSWPAGQFLVGLVGVVAVAVGGWVAYGGWKADFTKELDLGSVPRTAGRTAVMLGRVGRIARGVALVIIGILVVIAAVQYDPQKADGLDGALKSLTAQPFGTWVLTLIALGFIAYGLYGLAEAKLRRMS
jgi:hypothetical protein